MDERNRQYMSENMDEDLRTQTLGEGQYQDRQFGSQSEVIPPRKTYTSLWLFAENNPFRMRCRAIVDSRVSFCEASQCTLKVGLLHADACLSVTAI